MRCHQNFTKTIGKLARFIILCLAINLVLASAVNAISWPDILDFSRYLQVLNPGELGEPDLLYLGKQVILKYNVNDQVIDGSLSVVTYSDKACTVNITGNDFLVPSFLYDANPNPDGTKNREISLVFDIDPVGIQESDAWLQTEDDQFFIDFCYQIQLFSGDATDPTSTVLDEVETEINLKVDLLGDFGVEFPIAPRDPLIVEESRQFFVEGYICDEDLEQVFLSIPQRQGSVTRICVRPDAEARDAGIFMRRIDSFTFLRDDLPDGSTLSQEALRDGQSVSDFTTLYCARGREICFFDTLLRADFYFRPGTVFGYGEAWLQFGTGSIRKLEFAVKDSTRMLQEEVDGSFAGTTGFSLNFIVLPGADDDFFGAIAFECDDENKRLEESPVKQFGDTIRVCVVPDEVSNQFDVRINRIDVWNWTNATGFDDFLGIEDGLGGDAFQASVEEGGIQAEDGLTVLICPRGSTLCIFKTQFTDSFYDTGGDIIGIGDVILQYPEQIASSRISRRKLQDSMYSSGLMMEAMDHRFLQDISQIAGISRVTVNTTSEFASYEDRVPGGCNYSHKVSEWWEEEDENDQYMYIGIATGIVLALGCSFFACWMYPHCRRNTQKSGGNRGSVKVNVDLKNENKENIISEDSEEYDRSETTSGSSNRSLPDGSDDSDGKKRKSRKNRRNSNDLESNGKSRSSVKRTSKKKTVSKSSTKKSFKR